MLTKETALFRDRKDAGIRLGKRLAFENLHDALLLAIPRGGVEIAFYAAKELDTDFSVVIAKKLGLPGNEEFAFGAIAEDGSIHVSGVGRKRLNQEMIDRVVEQQESEIRRRIRQYRRDKPLPEIRDRRVVIIDDGIATGSTFEPVISMCKKNGAKEVIAAAPVGPSENVELLKEADSIIVLETPEPFYAVGQFYEDFTNLTDEQVMKFLRDQEKGE